MRKRFLSLILGLVLMLNPLTVLADSQSVNQEGNLGCTVTATVQDPSQYTVTVPKTLTINPETYDVNYSVDVEGIFFDPCSVNVVPDGSFTLTQGNKTVEVDIEQDRTIWLYDEADGTFSANGIIQSNELSVGDWVGTFSFAISLEDNLVDTTAKDTQGLDVNVNTSHVVGSREDAIFEALVDSNLISSRDDIDVLIKVDAEDYDNLGEVTFDVSDIAQPGDKVGILGFDDETDEWIYIGTEVVDGNNKVVVDNFSEYQTIVFVKVGDDGDFDVVRQHNYVKNTIAWQNTENSTYCFTQEGNKWTSNNQGIDSSTAQSTWTIELSSETEYSFKYKVSSEERYDKLTILLDDQIIVDNISGAGQEEAYTTTLPVGTHTITAKYIKDNSGNRDDDCGYIILEPLGAGHKCTNCGNEESHNYTFCVIQPTCTEKGSSTFTCEACGDSYTEEIPAHHVDNNPKDTFCDICNAQMPGAYDKDGNLIASWSKLEELGFDIVNSSYENNYTDLSDSTIYNNTRKIIIPNYVSKIGNYAFYDCTNITEIIIPNSITSIGSKAFYNCTNITEIIIPNSITSIGSYAFYSCKNLTSIVIPDSVTSIGEGMLDNCSNLHNVKLSNSIDNIPDSTFEYCAKLESISIPDSVTIIGESAFEDCSKLSNVKFPSNLVTVEYMAFSGCSLSSIELPHGLQTIGRMAFEDNTSRIEKVVLPDTLITIDQMAFDGTIIIELEVPSSVTTIGHDAFLGTKNVIYNGTLSSKYDTWGGRVRNKYRDGNFLYNDNTKQVLSLYVGTEKDVVIPDEVVTISSEAFYYLSNLENITIPSSVTNIGESAFKSCKKLTNIILPDNITYMGRDTFMNCTGLVSAKLPANLTSIPMCAFSCCTNLTNITFPDKLTSVGDSSFEGCSSLTSIDLPDTVTSISQCAFEYCYSLTSIELPSNLKSIYTAAFYGCTGLEEITIPSKVSAISTNTFSGCTNLKNVTFSGNSVTKLNDGAFKGCNSLVTIEIPDSVTTINSTAFSNCTNLTTIYYNGSASGRPWGAPNATVQTY